MLIQLFIACSAGPAKSADDSAFVETGEPVDSVPETDAPDTQDTGPADTAMGGECAGRDTWVGDLEIRLEADLVEFGERFDRVQGGLTLDHLYMMEDLDPIACLRSVDGALAIRSTLNLESIELPRLEYAGALTLKDNTAATRIALPALSSVAGDLSLSNMDEVPELHLKVPVDVGGELGVRLSGLRSLSLSAGSSLGGLTLIDTYDLESAELSDVEIGGRLYVWDAWSLTSLSLPGFVGPADGVYVDGNDVLERLSLPSLEVVEGLFQLRANPLLTELDLSALRIIAFDLDLSILGLADLSAFDGVESIGGGLRLSRLEVQDLRGLEGIDSLGSLEIDENSALESVDGLDGLTRITGDVLVYENPALQLLSGLDALEQIDGGLTLQDNALVDLQGLDALHTIGGSLDLDRAAVASLDGLRALESVTDISLRSLPSLTDVGGLTSLSRTGSLTLVDVDGLQSFAGLSGLSSLSGGFYVYSADSLESLDGLHGLRTVGAFLDLDTNPLLEDVSTLHTVESVGGNLRIEYNASLTTADAEALRDAIGQSNIGGSVFIEGNAE